MNTLELQLKAQNEPVLKQIFIGVFPCDKIPDIYKLPSALIVNLDNSDKPGTHWIAIFFDKIGKCEYFDSYGRKPPIEILNYVGKQTNRYTFNNKCIQDLWSISCGQMCLYYLIWRCRGISFKQIINSMFNDEFITGFVDCL